MNRVLGIDQKVICIHMTDQNVACLCRKARDAIGPQRRARSAHPQACFDSQTSVSKTDLRSRTWKGLKYVATTLIVHFWILHLTCFLVEKMMGNEDAAAFNEKLNDLSPFEVSFYLSQSFGTWLVWYLPHSKMKASSRASLTNHSFQSSTVQLSRIANPFFTLTLGRS